MASNFLEQLNSNQLIKTATDAIYNARHSLLPVSLAIAAFGGTTIYLIHSARTRRGVQTPSKEDAVKRSQAKSADDSFVDVVLADLPPETRSKIWTKLNYEDLLKLRLVAGFTKDDVENWVGVKVRISSRLLEQYEFSQKVALQSCLITDLGQDVDQDFFVNPSLMKRLEVIEKSPINLTDLEALLKPCTNLKTLQLHFLFSMDFEGISEMVLRTIQYLPNLKGLKVFRISVHSPTFKSLLNQNPKVAEFVVPVKLTEVEIEIPDVPENQVALWKGLLEKQTHLKTLVVNIGAVHWQFVQKIIPKNPGLERISLEGFCNIEPDSVTREPFDWRIFENCVNLRIFEIGCPPIINSEEYEAMASINFRKFPCKNIEEFYVYKVVMTTEDVRRVYTEMKQMSNGSLNQIGELGTEAAAEMFWIHSQQQETRRREWLEYDQWWEIVTNSALGLTILAMMFAVTRSRPIIIESGDDRQYEVWSAQSH